MEKQTAEPDSLHWRYHDTSQEQVRVWTDLDSMYGAFDVISAADFKKVMETGIYKDRPFWIDAAEYEDAW